MRGALSGDRAGIRRGRPDATSGGLARTGAAREAWPRCSAGRRPNRPSRPRRQVRWTAATSRPGVAATARSRSTAGRIAVRRAGSGSAGLVRRWLLRRGAAVGGGGGRHRAHRAAGGRRCSTSPGPIVQFGIPIARTLLDLFAVAAAGVAILARLLGFDRPEKTEPVMRARPPGRAVGIGRVDRRGAAVDRAADRRARTRARSRPRPRIWEYVSNIAAGKGLLLSAACGAGSVLLVPAEPAARRERAGRAAGRDRVVRAAAAAADRARVQLGLSRPVDGADGAARGDGQRLGRRARRGDRLPGPAARTAGHGHAALLPAGDLVRADRRASPGCSPVCWSWRCRR